MRQKVRKHGKPLTRAQLENYTVRVGELLQALHGSRIANTRVARPVKLSDTILESERAGAEAAIASMETWSVAEVAQHAMSLATKLWDEIDRLPESEALEDELRQLSKDFKVAQDEAQTYRLQLVEKDRLLADAAKSIAGVKEDTERAARAELIRLQDRIAELERDLKQSRELAEELM